MVILSLFYEFVVFDTLLDDRFDIQITLIHSYIEMGYYRIQYWKDG